MATKTKLRASAATKKVVKKAAPVKKTAAAKKPAPAAKKVVKKAAAPAKKTTSKKAAPVAKKVVKKAAAPAKKTVKKAPKSLWQVSFLVKGARELQKVESVTEQSAGIVVEHKLPRSKHLRTDFFPFSQVILHTESSAVVKGEAEVRYYDDVVEFAEADGRLTVTFEDGATATFTMDENTRIEATQGGVSGGGGDDEGDDEADEEGDDEEGDDEDEEGDEDGDDEEESDDEDEEGDDEEEADDEDEEGDDEDGDDEDEDGEDDEDGDEWE